MTDIRLRVWSPDLLTDHGLLDQPFAIEWARERMDVGGGSFVIPHDSPALVANAELIAPNSLVVVEDQDTPGWEGFAWIIRRRNRQRGDVWDPITVTGPGAIELLRQALVYPARGLDGPPQDTRAFGWYAWDYLLGPEWTDTFDSLGSYEDPTDPQLQGDPGEDAVNEVQAVVLDAEAPPYPWGSDYPSPGGLGGTWTLTFRGQTTAPIQWDASAGDVGTALGALSNIDSVTVTGSGTTADPYEVEFDGPDMAGEGWDLMSMSHSDLRHDHTNSGVTRVQAGSEGLEGEELVDGWPDAQSEWFGGIGQLTHFRRVLDVEAAGANAGPVMVYVVSLGDVDVWWDGEHLGDGSRLDVLQFRTDLFTTQHVVAFRANGPTMVTIQRVDDDDRPTGAVYRTFTEDVFGGSGSPDPWYYYDATGEPPGVTPGFILATLFDDAQDRGVLPPLSRDFTWDDDSMERGWSDTVEMGFQIGNDSVLSVAERLRDLDVDAEVTAGFVFRAFDGLRVDRGDTPDSGVATVTIGVNQGRELTKDTEDEQLTALLIRTETGWVEIHEAGDRREGFLSLGTVTSQRSASLIGNRHLRDLADPRHRYPFSTSAAQPGVAQPTTDYDVGDVIVGPKLAGGMTGEWGEGDVVVDTLAARVTTTGDVDWVHETEDAP